MSADERVLEILQRVWGHAALRPLQAEAIRASLARRDALVVLPTGGGKSLCYQLPPVATERLTIVISPLIALMEDQLAGLHLLGIPAAALHSMMEEADARDVFRRARAGELRLLLTSPERAVGAGFGAFATELAEAGALHALAIDEAHCISQWGHDFRPEYRRISELVDRMDRAGARPAVQCYTATATPPVREDIIRQLRLRDPAVLVGDFDRPNLTYRIVRKHKPIEQLAAALARHTGPDKRGGDGAIVYCLSRGDCEETAEALKARGFDAAPYHAGLSADKRTKVQKKFSNEKLDVVCATVAFGMGIDRSNVRLVAHASMPKSVEAYQQEAGRAGRDGEPAECLLLYGTADASRWKRLLENSAVEQGTDPQQLRAQLQQLDAMRAVCTALRCRHALLAEHFGQTYTPPTDRGCGACDVCLGESERVAEGNTMARKILSAVARCEQRFGKEHIVDVLRGRVTERIRSWNHDRLSTFGLLAESSRAEVSGYVDQLVDLGVLERVGDEYPVLVFGPRGMAVMKGEEAVELNAVASGSRDGKTRRERGGAKGMVEARPLDAEEAELFERLRALRRSIAEEQNVPPYVVFSDATLRELCRRKPGTPEAMLACKGVGRAKLEAFGEAFLAAIAGG